MPDGLWAEMVRKAQWLIKAHYYQRVEARSRLKPKKRKKLKTKCIPVLMTELLSIHIKQESKEESNAEI